MRRQFGTIPRKVRSNRGKGQVIHCDEIRVPVQDAVKVRSGRLWVYLGDRNHPFTVSDYRTTKARAGPAEVLKSYRGYLHADAANVFDGLYTPGGIVEVGCWAHARRHVHAALTSDAALATQALTRIGGLYLVERMIAEGLQTQGLTGDAADAVRLEVRQREGVPQLASLKQWIDESMPGLLPKSPIRQGFAYIQRHWVALNRYAGWDTWRSTTTRPSGLPPHRHRPPQLALRRQRRGRQNRRGAVPEHYPHC